MTVQELYNELEAYIKMGHADTRVIANCEFTITKGNGYYSDYPLTYLQAVYYQSGDIEIAFGDREEYDE